MRHRPQHFPNRYDPDQGPTLDHAPHVRLLLLYAAFVVPFVVIGGRLAWVQTVIPGRFLAEFDTQTEEFETVPCRDGRILTSDGMVVACDVPQYDLEVHYRWLENPPNESWLTRQARSLLSPGDRRKPELVAAARNAVLAQREAMFAALAAAAAVPREDLRVRCARIQDRVDRVYEYVARLQNQRAREIVEPAGQTDMAWWDRGWLSFCRELTSPPERTCRDPLVIKEQEEYHALVRDVPLATVGAVESLPSQFPGICVRITTRRVYPQQSFAAHVIGVRTPLTDDELQSRAEQFSEGDPLGYQTGDRIGRNGLELAYDSLLHGRAGVRRIVKDRHGVVVHSELVRAPVEGRDVVLSFDSRLQASAEALLDEALLPAAAAESSATPMSTETLDAPPASKPPQGGCIVAVDVRDGRILAAAAAPRFDINLLVDFDAEEWEQTTSDPRQPFFPRVTQMMAPPGSVFKVLTSVALLESGLVDPEATCHCRGYLDQPDRDRCLIYRHYGVGHGDVNLETALCQSCNVYFFQAARTIGPEAIHDWAVRFGLGRQTGCGLPGERDGNVPSPEAAGQPWYPGTTLQFAIGQASLTVTPLQVARMMAAIANDGVLVTPHFVSDPDRSARHESEPGIQLAAYESAETLWPVQRIAGLSPETLWRIRAGLRRVVDDPHGTGKRIKLERIAIAGKTGTAEVGGGQPDHAWFAGYAPADNPRVAFVVVLENGGSGGQVAGPVARRFVEAMLETGTLRSDAR